MQKVLLVDEQDHPIRFEEKQYAHEQGYLHRAFSIFLYHDQKILLQRRAMDKYHCGGLWTNICCSHPLDDDIMKYAKQRLFEEVHIQDVLLEEIGSMTYRAEFENGLIEHEVDHLLIGVYDQSVYQANPDEVEEIKWMDSTELQNDVSQHPQKYTPWFIQALDQVLRYIKEKKDGEVI